MPAPTTSTSHDFIACSSLGEQFARHAVARLDGALHAAGPDPVVGVLAGEEHSSVEGRRDQWQHRFALIADWCPDDRTRPRVMSPALDESEQALDRATDDRAHGGVDAVEDLVVRQARWFDVARRQARDDYGLAALMHGLFHDEAGHAVREAA